MPVNEYQAVKLRKEFLQALSASLEAKNPVLRVKRGRIRGHLTLALKDSSILDLSALMFNGQPELTRVRIGSWIELTLATEELPASVRGVANWILFQAATAECRYVWSPAATRSLTAEDRLRFESRQLIQPVNHTYDPEGLAALLWSQVEQQTALEEELFGRGLLLEASDAQAERLNRLDALVALLTPEVV